MSEERFDRIEARLTEGFRLVDERFREAAGQARQEYDNISQAITTVRTFASTSIDALRRTFEQRFDRMEGKLDRVLATRPARSPRRRRR